ncbi:MAG: phage major capsid protein [Actinomycetia bacterium]|nr:phage major capsid protein [Actinomycetes bacterium]
MAGSKTWGSTGLLSTTLEKYLEKAFQEQIFTSRVLLWILKSSGRILNADGGVSLLEPILTDSAPNVGSYADYDVFATDPNKGFGMAEFNWRQFYGLIHISGIEQAMNMGEAAVINLLQARVSQLEETMGEEINKQLFSNGAGNSGKDFDGLALLIDAASTVGGIDRTTDTYWQSKVTTGVGLTAGLIAAMRTMYNDVSEGNDHPTNLLTVQSVYENYENLLQPQIRYTDTKMADAGFQNLLFKGAPIAWDRFADYGFTDGAVATAEDPIWFLNMKYLALRKLDNVWFKSGDLLQPTNQDAFYKNVRCYGNMTVSYPKRLGVLHNANAITGP